MAQVFKCDRCDNSFEGQGAVLPGCYVEYFGGYDGTHYGWDFACGVQDLCPYCAEELAAKIANWWPVDEEEQ